MTQEVKIPLYINTNSKGKTTCEFIKQCGQKFAIYIEDGVATYHPISPKVPPRGA